MHSTTSDRREKLVAFVEREYSLNQSLLANATTAVVASRSVGLTLIAAVLGVALTQHSWPVAAVGCVIVPLAYVVDAYYSWRLAAADDYERQLEDVLSHQYTVLQRAPNNAAQLTRLDRRLRTLRVGSLSRLRTFKRGDVWYGQPRAMFQGLYPVLIAGSLLATVVLAATATSQGSSAEHQKAGQQGTHTHLSSPAHRQH